MTRIRLLTYAVTVVAVSLTVILSPVPAAAANQWFATDTYFANTVKANAPASLPTTWIPMGDTFNSDASGNSACSTGWSGGNLGNGYDTSSEAGNTSSGGSSGWTNSNLSGTVNISCAASASWPCCQHGTPTANKAGPFSSPTDQSTWTALELNGGVNKMYSAPWGASTWELCEWFAVPNNQGAIVMATAMDSKGVPAANSLVLATGTINNLVLYQYGNSSSAAVSENYPENGSWTFACINWNSSTNVASIVGFNGTTTHTATFASAVNYTSSGLGGVNTTTAWAAGDLFLYGLTFATCNGCLNYQWTSPTNPASGGGGSIGNPVSGSGTSGCTQTGIISGEPKFQWCGPQLGCNNIDLSWTNLGNDFAWLGCIIEQGFLSVVASVVNALIDLIVPSVAVLQSDWASFYPTTETHVPLNYVTGALTAFAGVFGSHSGASPATGSVTYFGHTVTYDFSTALGWLTPYRGVMLAFLYVAFGFAVIRHARTWFAN